MSEPCATHIQRGARQIRRFRRFRRAGARTL